MSLRRPQVNEGGLNEEVPAMEAPTRGSPDDKSMKAARRDRPRRLARPENGRKASAHQAFSLQRLDHLGTRSDARHVLLERRPFAEVEVHELGPAENGEEIAVGDGEFVAHEMRLAVELLHEPIKLLGESRLHGLLPFGG